MMPTGRSDEEAAARPPNEAQRRQQWRKRGQLGAAPLASTNKKCTQWIWSDTQLAKVRSTMPAGEIPDFVYKPTIDTLAEDGVGRPRGMVDAYVSGDENGKWRVSEENEMLESIHELFCTGEEGASGLDADSE